MWAEQGGKHRKGWCVSTPCPGAAATQTTRIRSGCGQTPRGPGRSANHTDGLVVWLQLQGGRGADEDHGRKVLPHVHQLGALVPQWKGQGEPRSMAADAGRCWTADDVADTASGCACKFWKTPVADFRNSTAELWRRLCAWLPMAGVRGRRLGTTLCAFRCLHPRSTSVAWHSTTASSMSSWRTKSCPS